MNNLNLMGRLVKEVKTTFTKEGKAISNFTIAVKRNGKAETSDFLNCTAFGKTAEVITEHCHKGDRVLIEGSIQNNNWTDDKGGRHYDTNIVVNRFHFIENKKFIPSEDSENLPK